MQPHNDLGAEGSAQLAARELDFDEPAPRAGGGRRDLEGRGFDLIVFGETPLGGGPKAHTAA